MTGPQPGVVPFGDRALLVVLGDGIDEALSRRVHALAARLRAEAGRTGATWGAPVAGYASLLVPLDPARDDRTALAARIEPWLAEALAGDPPPDPPGAPLEVGVRYGGADGPDLATVAERTGLSPAAVAELHASVVYRVFLLGFSPGFGYLGPLPAPLELPRRADPRPRVPAGSIAIAGGQTAIYPSATPGGWHLIGRTDVRPWDPRREPPVLLVPGGRVRFVPLAVHGA